MKGNQGPRQPEDLYDVLSGDDDSEGLSPQDWGSVLGLQRALT